MGSLRVDVKSDLYTMVLWPKCSAWNVLVKARWSRQTNKSVYPMWNILDERSMVPACDHVAVHFHV